MLANIGYNVGVAFGYFPNFSNGLRGQQGGESVLVGLKDNTDPDDGSEARKLVRLEPQWQRVEIPLNFFRTASSPW